MEKRGDKGFHESERDMSHKIFGRYNWGLCVREKEKGNFCP
jgi:hypothetical protein